ncbi:MAG TPA: murein L,D-transpeptidase catalytic domain family protein [Novosphingobium sp.]|nr:murein L,D-transpeptidase catalytic domain family protein [Novosphingobium sp.]
MKFNRRHFLGAMVAGTAGLVSSRSYAATLCGETPALLPQAMAALDAHAHRIAHRDVIGIVNFAAHSRLPRFQLVDVAGGQVLRTLLVAHGSGSDPAASGWTERFSNRPGSNASSKGAFVTGPTYVGKHGRSRKLIGLEPRNEAAERRAIVIHGADYVSQNRALSEGRIGRSQGCFAVSRAEIGDLLALLGEGRLLYAWKDEG